MECPSDLLKSECKSTEARKKNSQNMVLLGLGIASKSGVSFSAGSTTTSTTTSPTGSTNSAAEATSVSGITNEHNKLRAQENASLPNLTWDATVADYALRKVTFLANSLVKCFQLHRSSRNKCMV